MSDLKTITRKFKLDFADWEWLLRQDGETDESIAEIKQCIRNDWDNEEFRNLWIDYVAKEAAFRRELINMGKKVNERMRHVASGS